MKHLLVLAALFVGTYVTANAQCAPLQYKVDNQTSCTYTVVITYMTCSSSYASTSALTATANQSNYYNLPPCIMVTQVRVFDAGSGTNNANLILNSVTLDDVGDCSGSSTDDAEWMDGQTTWIY
jgi:hypothetical protein